MQAYLNNENDLIIPQDYDGDYVITMDDIRIRHIIIKSARDLTLSSHLKFSGNLIANKTGNITFPKKFYVSGDLDLKFSKTTYLPPGLKVRGSCFLDYSSIANIAENIWVGGIFSLTNTINL